MSRLSARVGRDHRQQQLTCLRPGKAISRGLVNGPKWQYELKHRGTINVLHTLRPIGVAMAGKDTFDPYRD